MVFWGSQSGTAEKLAFRLSKEMRQRFGKVTLAADMSDFDSATIADIPSSKLVIFMLSTYGEGEPSDNVGEFWNWLSSNAGGTLSQTKFAAFGLGNSNYKHYNAVINHVTSCLQNLGAQSLLATGKADDSQGQTEEHYLEWKSVLFDKLQTTLGFEEHEPVYEPAIRVADVPGDANLEVHYGSPWKSTKSRANRSVSPIHALPIKQAKELFKTTQGRNCIHMEIDLTEQPGLKYRTGDHLGIWPSNPAMEVTRLLNSLGREGERNTMIQVREVDSNNNAKVPECTTLDALFTHYLEVCAPLSREEIGSIAQFAPTSSAKDTLLSFSKNKSEYEDLLRAKYINLGRLLELVAHGPGTWKHLPLSFVVETLPAMRPRYYSISSSSVVQPRRVAITAIVADKILPGKQRIPGLCTNFLRNHKASFEHTGADDATHPCSLLAHVRKSTFKLPTLSSHPIIMVAAGTGIAPFRGFLQERAALFKMGRPVGEMVLIFGCRNEDDDYLYKDELQELQAGFASKLTILTAFSRPHPGRKMYVQDRVAEHCTNLVNLMVEDDANFYICGSAAMARDVSKAVATALSDVKNWTDIEAHNFMDRQRRSKRWHQDVWG